MQSVMGILIGINSKATTHLVNNPDQDRMSDRMMPATLSDLSHSHPLPYTTGTHSFAFMKIISFSFSFVLVLPPCIHSSMIKFSLTCF